MDNLQVPQNWVNVLFAAVISICAWVYRRTDRKVEKIAATYVTRAEINDLLSAHNTRVEAMHADNTRNFSELRAQLEGVNTKLFELNGKVK